MANRAKASIVTRLGASLVVAVLAHLVTGACAGDKRGRDQSVIYWSIRQVRRAMTARKQFPSTSLTTSHSVSRGAFLLCDAVLCQGKDGQDIHEERGHFLLVRQNGLTLHPRPFAFVSLFRLSSFQAQQMCDMPLPRGHENDGSPVLPKAHVQRSVDARALHLCQQWNYVVAQMQSEGKMVGYELKPIIPAENFHEVKGGSSLAGPYPAATQAIDAHPEVAEHVNAAEGVHADAEANFKYAGSGANALADDVLFVGGALLAGFAVRHLWNMRSGAASTDGNN